MKRCVAAAWLLATMGCGVTAPEPELHKFQEIPPFTLTASNGQPFDSAAALAGKVWIADFIFTTCRGPCPRMSTWMTGIQGKLEDVPDVRLVSFTVDPVNDTPEVMAAYGQRYQAQPGRWFLLTGPQETLHQLKRYGFMLGDVDLSLNHSTRFVLVDRTGMVRGYYSSSESEQMEQLIADARRLVKEG